MLSAGPELSSSLKPSCNSARWLAVTTDSSRGLEAAARVRTGGVAGRQRGSALTNA